jgi:hypothetical protein
MKTFKELFLQPIFTNIPADLRELPWAVWIAGPRKVNPHKFNKASRCPKTGHKIGTFKGRKS